MINSREDVLNLLEDYLETEHERILPYISDNGNGWDDHKQVLYINGVVLGKLREGHLETKGALQREVADNALVNEIKACLERKICSYKSQNNLDIMEKKILSLYITMLEDLSKYGIDDWLNIHSKCIDEENISLSKQEKKTLVFLYYAYDNYSEMRKHLFNADVSYIEKAYEGTLDGQNALDKYGLLSINDDIELLAINIPRIYDKRINRTFLIKNVTYELLQQISKLISEGLISKFAVRLENDCGYYGRVYSTTLSEALERGKIFEFSNLGKYQVNKLYSENYRDSLWIVIDSNDITFEELHEDYEVYEDMIVTQVVHMQYDIEGEKSYIIHLDHEFVFYTVDEYEIRQENVRQKGNAKKRLKSFKIDNAKIPFETMVLVERKNEGGKAYLVEEQFLCYVLETYFKHKDLLLEYFQNVIESD